MISDLVNFVDPDLQKFTVLFKSWIIKVDILYRLFFSMCRRSHHLLISWRQSDIAYRINLDFFIYLSSIKCIYICGLRLYLRLLAFFRIYHRLRVPTAGAPLSYLIESLFQRVYARAIEYYIVELAHYHGGGEVDDQAEAALAAQIRRHDDPEDEELVPHDDQQPEGHVKHGLVQDLRVLLVD